MGLRFLLYAGVPALSLCSQVPPKKHSELGPKNAPVVVACLLSNIEGGTMKKKITTAVFFALLLIATGSVQARADVPMPTPPLPGIV
jgi:hypothetical protein